MTNVWLVAPAFGRYDVTAVAFRQWARLRDAVEPDGIHIDVVVVSDDDNLHLARVYDFHTIEQNNEQLGRRYNDGFEYAFGRGADFAADAGTRNFIHPDLLREIPWTPRITHSGNLYSIATPEGVTTFSCHNEFGRGPMFLPRAILERWPRPVDEDAFHLIMHTICANVRPLLAFSFTNVHDFQYVGIYPPGGSHVTSLNDYVGRWGVERTHPLKHLDGHYAVQDVNAALHALSQPVAA